MAERGLLKALARSLSACLSALLLLALLAPSSSAIYAYEVEQGEQQFNAPSFSAGNAFDFNFGDSVNLFSGNLVVTATDVSLPGRNGLGVTVSRVYNSNIFVHRNQCSTPGIGDVGSSFPCGDDRNTLTCGNCDPPAGNALRTETCCEGDPLATSWKKARWLGRGWDIDYGRLKDPTLMFFDKQITPRAFPLGVPNKGTSSMSLVLQNSELPIYHPKQFLIGDPNNYPFPWGTSLGESYLDSEYMVGPGLGLSGELIEGYIGGSGTRSLQYTPIYTAYVGSGLSPINIAYDWNSASGMSSTDVQPLGATFYSNGVEYVFTHYVKFCGQFDDIPSEAFGCMDQRDIGSDAYYNWAENPYAGLYLTKVVDKAGNFLSIGYWGTTYTSPYIYEINDTFKRRIHFEVPSSSSINARLDYITYPNYRGNEIKVDYVYNNVNDFGTVPAGLLLKEVRLLNSSNGALLLPPVKYAYDPSTQELNHIEYPNGVIVNYQYGDADMYIVDYNRAGNSKRTNRRRVVTNRSVLIPGENDGNPYVWGYNYRTDYTNSGSETGLPFPLSITEVTDPYGNKVVHKFLTPVAPPVKLQSSGAYLSGDFGIDWAMENDDECRYAGLDKDKNARMCVCDEALYSSGC